jgi:hypothetical protein
MSSRTSLRRIPALFLLAAAGALLLPACAVDAVDVDRVDVEPLAGGPPGQCAVLCLAPPEGCEYRGGVFMGPCNAVHCGHLVCQPSGGECPMIDCAAPPPGCQYEGMILSPCQLQTCGTLVCDGETL